MRKKKWWFLAALIGSAGISSPADASITLAFTNQTWTGFTFSELVDYTTTNVVGMLTSVSVNVTLNAAGGQAYANDLAAYVDVKPLGTGGTLQVGGYNLLAANPPVGQRYYWAGGNSSAVGTTMNETVTLTTPIVFTGDESVDGTIYVGNGYGATGSTLTVTGSVTFNGVNAVPIGGGGSVPEPSSGLAFAVGPLAYVWHKVRRRRHVAID